MAGNNFLRDWENLASINSAGNLVLPSGMGLVVTSNGITVTAGGLTVTAGGLTVTAGGFTVTAGGLAVTAGGLLVAAGAIGYATGAGGAITQATNRATGVTLNTVTGTITTNNASLAAEATAEFTVTNSAVAIGDTVIVSEQSGSNGGGTLLAVTGVAAGSFNISVHNGNVAAGTAETGAILINFAVIKAVSA